MKKIDTDQALDEAFRFWLGRGASPMEKTQFAEMMEKSMTTSAKRAGSKFEIDVMQWLRERGLTAERLAKAGSNDEGDLVMAADDLVVVFEQKVRREKTSQLTLGTFMSEAVREAENYSNARSLATPAIPAVLVKRSNKPIDETFVVLRLKDFVK